MRWLIEDAHGGGIPPTNLFLVESAALVKMHSCFLDLSLVYRRVPLGLVEILDVRVKTRREIDIVFAIVSKHAVQMTLCSQICKNRSYN